MMTNKERSDALLSVVSAYRATNSEALRKACLDEAIALGATYDASLERPVIDQVERCAGALLPPIVCKMSPAVQKAISQIK